MGTFACYEHSKALPISDLSRRKGIRFSDVVSAFGHVPRSRPIQFVYEWAPKLQPCTAVGGFDFRWDLHVEAAEILGGFRST